jgi:thiol-disulfide isomerase/thioredoxin
MPFRHHSRRSAWPLLVALLAGTGALCARAAGPNLHIADGPGLKKTVASHRGKVVVLNLWATWCGPCVDEFPDLVATGKKYQDRGVVLMTVSIDEPKDRARVVAFLNSQNSPFPSYMRDKGTMEQLVHPIDRKWDYAVPSTYVFDRKGKMSRPLVGPQSVEEFSTAIERALKG